MIDEPNPSLSNDGSGPLPGPTPILPEAEDRGALRRRLAFGVAAGLCVILAWLFFDYRHYLHAPEPGLKSARDVEIKSGLGLRQVANLLHQEGVISRPFWFIFLARLHGSTASLQAGEYTFTPGLTPVKILDMLRKGEISGVRLVAPEGFTIFQIARRLDETGLWSGERFLALARDPKRAKAMAIPAPSLEGYLFPATYPLKKSMTEEDVLQLMLHRGQEEKTPERLAQANTLGLSWHQVLTLASLVQAETSYAEEMPRIAGVFLKRIQVKMRLQCDPTAIYGRKDLDQGVTAADIKRDTPYNTYRHPGLPPGPIGNPGADALAAALHPTAGDDLYFVATGDGRHAFAKTFDQHKKNVEELRKKRGK